MASIGNRNSKIFFVATETTARPSAGTKKGYRTTDFTDYTDEMIET